jgi:hypothetical protein
VQAARDVWSGDGSRLIGTVFKSTDGVFPMLQIGREFITMEIDEQETLRFEAFLDRNFPGWRQREMFVQKNAKTITRKWSVGLDDIERTALYRKQYVEIYDTFFDLDDSGDVVIEYPKNLLCDINGDLTPVAIWKID